MRTAVAVKGAVITHQDSTMGTFNWQGKCEKCGDTNGSRVSSAVIPSSGQNYTRDWVCLKCGNRQEAEIRSEGS